MVRLVTVHFVPGSFRTSLVISYLLFGHKYLVTTMHVFRVLPNGITISFKVLLMVPLEITLEPMVMSVVPLALPMAPLVQLESQWYHWLPIGYQWYHW